MGFQQLCLSPQNTARNRLSSVMNILVAPNAFKGSFSAVEASSIIADALSCAGHLPVKHPVTDGGDGFVSTINSFLHGEIETVSVIGPEGFAVSVELLFCDNDCYIGASQACGMAGCKGKDPFLRTSLGVGQAIKEALKKSPARILVGLGGSATVDMGIGAAYALGAIFYDETGKELEISSVHDIYRVASCDPSASRALVGEVEIVALCDVEVILLGVTGGLATFGPQKGVTAMQMSQMLSESPKVACVFNKNCGVNASELPGSGSAGGLGAGLVWFAGATLKKGFDEFSRLTHLEERIAECDLVLTGEGRFDATSFVGKASVELQKLCKDAGKKLIVISGSRADGFAPEGIEVVPVCYFEGEDFIDCSAAEKALRRTVSGICDKLCSGGTSA